MAKGKRRQAIAAKKALKRSAAYKHGGGDSAYARKRKYLDREGGWGFDYPEPKPWK